MCSCVRNRSDGDLFQQGQVTAALTEAQQQRQDVDGAGGLGGLLGPSGISLGQTKLLGHCEGGGAK